MKIKSTFLLFLVYCIPFVQGAMGQNAPIIADATFSIDEYSGDPNGTVFKTPVGKVTASDPDGGGLSYSIVDGNKDAFSINLSGVITVRDEDILDYEVNPVFTLIVQASDRETPPRTARATVIINLNDVAPNDLCVNPVTIGIGETITGTTYDASGDWYVAPSCGGNRTDNGSRGVWYRLVGNGQAITISTCSGNKYSFDNTSVNVYQGSCVTGLVCVAGSEGTGIAPECGVGGRQGRLKFPSEQGVEYLIFVDGFARDVGNFDLTTSGEPIVSIPANDHCQDAELLTVFPEGEGTPTDGSNENASAYTRRILSCDPLGHINDVWYRFNSGPNVAINVKTSWKTAGYVSAALYNQCGGEAIACRATAGNVFWDVKPNTDYWIQVWNSAKDEGSFTIQLNDGPNTAPTIFLSGTFISRFKPEGGITGLLTRDKEGHDQLYSIVEGNAEGIFGISETTGYLFLVNAAALAASSATSYELVVQVDDQGPGSLSTRRTITVSVFDNAYPVVSGKSINLDENTPNSTVVTNVDATDADGDGLSYRITAGNTDDAFIFNTEGGIEVHNQDALDFETNPVFELKIQVIDDGPVSLRDTATVTITLNDINEKPLINDIALNFSQHSTNGFSVVDVDFEDEDEGQNHTFSITSGNINNIFAIDNTGEITINNATALSDNGSRTYELTVTVSDDGTPVKRGTATISLTAVDNNPPAITSASFTVDENTNFNTLVGTLQGADPDGDDLTYSLLDGGKGAFTVSANGEIRVFDNRELDFEKNTSFTLLVQVEDDAFYGALSVKKEIQINVNDVNEKPVVQPFEQRISALVPDGFVVGAIKAKDPENETLSFSIKSGNEDNTFNIDETTGVLTVADASLFKPMVKPFYDLLINVEDGDGNARGLNAYVYIYANTLPQLTINTFEIDENSAAGTLLGQLTSDDIHPILKFEILDEEYRDLFVLDEINGALSLSGSDTLDYESNQQFDFTVFLTDEGPGSGFVRAEATITIIVNDVNEFTPVLDSIGNKSVQLGDELTFTATATDEDGTSVLSYALDGASTDKGMGIDTNTGLFRWTPNTGQAGKHIVEVAVTDGMFSDYETIIIEVPEINESAPVLDAIGDKTIVEGEELTFTVIASDDDNNPTFMFSLDDASKGKGMRINAGTGVFTWTPGSDQAGAHRVGITVDDGKFSDAESITIRVLRALGLEDPLKRDFMIYPNPATNTIDLSLDNAYTGEVIVRVLDPAGKELIRKNLMKSQSKLQNQLDISTLGGGIYMVELKTKSDKKLIHRIIKE